MRDRPKEEGKCHGSSTGSKCCYFVEARNTSLEPVRMVNGVLLSREWVRLPTVRVPSTASIEARQMAVPSVHWPSVAGEHGLMDREAAYAFAVRFQVDSGFENEYSAGHGVLCIETRLVEVSVQWSYAITEIGVCEPVKVFEQLRGLKSSPRPASEASDAVAGDAE